MIISRLKSNTIRMIAVLASLYLKLFKPQPQTHEAHSLSPIVMGFIASLLLLSANPHPGFALSFDEIIEQNAISIALYRDFPPFSYRENGQLKGVDVEIAHQIAKKLGVDLHIRELTADENVDDDLRNAVWKGHYLDKKVADIMLHVPYDRELDRRNELVVLFAPYFKEEMVVARNIKKLGQDATLAHFRYEKIAVELDSLADIYLSGAFNGTIRQNILHYSTMSAAAQQTLHGKAAGLMGPRSSIEHALQHARAQYQIGQVPAPGLSMSHWLLGLAVKSDYRQLGYAVGDIIGTMVTSGQMAKIFDKYGLTYTPPAAGFYN